MALFAGSIKDAIRERISTYIELPREVENYLAEVLAGYNPHTPGTDKREVLLLAASGPESDDWAVVDTKTKLSFYRSTAERCTRIVIHRPVTAQESRIPWMKIGRGDTG